MKNYFKKFSIMFVMSLVLMLGFCTSAFADDGCVIGITNLNNTSENSAKMGDRLKSPEKGWKRYDDSNSVIKYMGNIIVTPHDDNYYNGNMHFTPSYGDSSNYVQFEFYGNKLRVIGKKDVNSSILNFNIDGKDYIVNNTTSVDNIFSALVFEKLDLNLDLHKVTITNVGSKEIQIDAIDISVKGNLGSYDESITLDKLTMNLVESDLGQLTATTTPASVGVTWKSSDPSIATIEVDPTNGKLTKVNALKEGTCTITATTTDGSNLSASCTVNVTKKDVPKPDTPTNSDTKTGAILIINLTDGETKVFDVSTSEVDEFKSWYNTKTKYEDKLTYEFNKTVNSSISIEEDIVHEKITSYEIRKY